MFGPPPDSPPPPDDDLASPPGTPPDMNFQDVDSVGGPPDDDDFGPPPGDDDFEPPDDDDFGPPDEDDFGPPGDDSIGGPPPDDDMPPPPDGPGDDFFGPPDDDIPPDMDDAMGPPDDMSFPGSGPPSVAGSGPPSSPGGSLPGSLPGDPPDMFPPPDDESFPPDSPGNTLPSDMPPPSIDDETLPPDTDSLPSLPPDGLLPVTPRSNKPSRSSVASMDSLLNDGLDIKNSPLMRQSKLDGGKRTARIGQADLGVGILRRGEDDNGSVEEKDSSDASTLRSDALESRPTVPRKKGSKPSKFKGSKGYDSDDVSAEDDSRKGSGVKVDAVDYTSKRKNSVIIDGEEYLVLQGKFEGDGYEDLRIKVDRNIMYIKMAADPNAVIPFDLLSDTKVTRDSTNPCKFMLKQFGSVITFQAATADVVDTIIKKIPEVALQAFNTPHSPNSIDGGSVEEKVGGEAHDGTTSRTPFSSSFTPEDFDYDDYYDFEDGMMKREELIGGEGDSMDGKLGKKREQRKPRVTRVVGKSTLRDVKAPEDMIEGLGVKVKGYNRKELIDTHLQKPKFSVRRVKQLCRWIASLRIWPRPVAIMTLHQELCNGLLLCRIMAAVVPTVKFMHLNERPLTKKAAIENLEQALGAIWRSKCVNNFRIPTSDDIYNGNTSKICVLVQEVFEVYVLKPLYAFAPKMFSWYNTILKQYSAPLPEGIFTDGDLIGLWAHMQNGFAIFCVFYHLFGPVAIGEGLNMVRIDSLRIKRSTNNIKEYRDNMSYVFKLLRAQSIEVLWDLDDWITYPDTEFIVLQLFFIYENLKGRQCSLPPAQGTSAGVTSGPNGEPMVSGMVYADSLDAANIHKRCSVLLGSGEGALPVLPIDTSGDAEGYNRMVCPPGLLSNKVKIVHSSVEVKGHRAASERKDWNSRTVVDVMEERMSGTPQLATLKALNSGMLNREDFIEDSGEDFSNSDVMRERNELALAMETLEHAMLNSENELNSMEDDLAARYMELESLSDRLGQVEYNSRLTYLEKERLMLEEERFKMQEHFTLRLKQIREKHSQSSSGSGFSTPKKSTQTSSRSMSKSGRSPVKKQHPESTDRDTLKRAERGWNNFVRRKDTHNAALGRGNIATSSTFMSVSQTSKWDAGVDQSTISGKFKWSFKSPNTMKNRKSRENPVTGVEKMWNNFKTKLRSETVKWASSRSYGHNDKLRELMNTRNYEYIRGRTTNKIPLNVVRSVSNAQSERDADGVDPRGYHIRQRELQLMQFEETRRYVVIQEKMSAYQTSAKVKTEFSQDHEAAIAAMRNTRSRAPSSTLTQATPRSVSQYSGPEPFGRGTSSVTASPVKPQQSRQTSQSLHSGGVSVSVKNVDAVISWMSFPRDISLLDRHSQKRYTCVVETEFVAGKEHYALKWYECGNTGPISTIDHSSVLIGYVLLQDINSCQVSPKDSTVLIVQISSSVRAIKSSCGRTALSIMFESDGECSKFMVGINTMQEL